MSFDVVVRAATLSDLPFILSIEKNCPTVTWPQESFLSELTDKNTISRVAFIEDVLAGYCMCPYVVDECTINTIAVLPQYRRKGIGNLLLKDVFVIAAKKNIRKIFLEVRARNVLAKEFYRASGFKVDGIRKGYYSDTDDDAILMSCEM